LDSRRGPLLALVVAIAVCTLPAAAEARFNSTLLSRGAGPNDIQFRVFNSTTGDPDDVDFANKFSPVLVRLSIGGYRISNIRTAGDGGYASATSCGTDTGAEGNFIECFFGSDGQGGQGIRAGQGVTITFETRPRFPNQPSGGSAYHAEMTGGAVEDGFLSGPTGATGCRSGQVPTVSGVRWEIVSNTYATVSRDVDAHGCPVRVRWMWATQAEWNANPNTYPHEGLETAFPGSGKPKMIFGFLKDLKPETTYHYTLTATSEDGFAIGPDAVITTATAGPLPPRDYKAFSDGTKRAFRSADKYMDYAASGLAVVAAAAVLAGDVVTKTIGGYIGLVAATVKFTGSSLGFLANDPPDPKFRKLAQPSEPFRVRLRRAGAPRAFVRAVRAYISNAGSLRANAQALLDSWERRQGARAAGVAEWVEQQTAAAQYFAHELADDLVAEVRLRARLRRAVAGTPFAGTLTASGFEALQDIVARTGFPTYVRKAIRRLGERKSAQRALRKGAARLDPRGAIGLTALLSSATLDEAQRRAARRLKRTRLRP
jgi:hypothetical protein